MRQNTLMKQYGFLLKREGTSEKAFYSGANIISSFCRRYDA